MTQPHNDSELPVILLVEDDDIDFMLFERMVKRHELPARIVRATDAQHGLEHLIEAATTGKDWPALTVLDLNTPRMSGIDFLDAVRADERIAHATVFVFTTSTAARDVEAAYRRNVAGYVVKEVESVQLADFLNLLTTYLQNVRCTPLLEPV